MYNCLLNVPLLLTISQATGWGSVGIAKSDLVKGQPRMYVCREAEEGQLGVVEGVCHTQGLPNSDS